jgi:hypothetical protein
MFDFPNSPTVGQIVTGGNGASYQWDGVKWDASSAITGAAANNVGRNLLHNGLFNIAQRGDGPLTTNGFAADRWAFYRDTDTGAITRNVTALGGIAGDESSAYYMLVDFTGSVVASGLSALYQSIEDVRRLAGKTVTVSFYALCWAGNIKLGVSFDQNFGTGGSPSAIVSTAGQSITLNQAWQRYSLTFNIPSVIGKTLGTNNNHFTIMDFFFSAGANNAIRSGNVGVQTGKVQLWGMQLEIGNVMTPLEKPDPQVELANCQRFYQVIPTIMDITAYAPGPGFYIFQQIFFPTMRVAPTVVPTYGTMVNVSPNGLQNQTTNRFEFYGASTAAGTMAMPINVITLSADL